MDETPKIYFKPVLVSQAFIGAMNCVVLADYHYARGSCDLDETIYPMFALNIAFFIYLMCLKSVLQECWSNARIRIVGCYLAPFCLWLFAGVMDIRTISVLSLIPTTSECYITRKELFLFVTVILVINVLQGALCGAKLINTTFINPPTRMEPSFYSIYPPESSPQSSPRSSSPRPSLKCSICLESIDSENKGIRLECEHVFHKPCIDTWINTHEDSQTCPNCRVDIDVV